MKQMMARRPQITRLFRALEGFLKFLHRKMGSNERDCHRPVLMYRGQAKPPGGTAHLRRVGILHPRYRRRLYSYRGWSNLRQADQDVTSAR
jgi:hypothetical protein